MLRFLVRRLLFGVLVVWLVSTTVFFLSFAAPSDPAVKMAGKQATPQVIELVRQRLGLDEPLIVQYGRFLSDLVQGNLGYSFFYDTSVNSLVAERLPVTASLVLGAAVIWMIAGISTGILSATRPRGFIDRAATVFVLTGISMPTFL
ncbi:MAG TPA: ABC transporter permease, partial [Actinopolymorphaceae bacterium]